MNIKEAIGKVVTGKHLTETEMISVMDEIMSGAATEAQIGSFITALRMKGETIDEIVGAVRVMREKATFVDTGVDTASGEVLMDIVGTGGDEWFLRVVSSLSEAGALAGSRFLFSSPKRGHNETYL